MDHQRSNFYKMREQVLLGTGVANVIWTMIGEAIDDAVAKYITEDYVAATVSEWARSNFDVMIDPQDLKGIRRIEDLEDFIKNAAKTDIETNLGVTLQEYMGEDPEDPADWDTKGLASWAMSNYQVQVSQNQLRKMDSHSVEEMLKEAVLEQIGKRRRAAFEIPGAGFCDAGLCDWVRDKFGVDVKPNELLADPRGTCP